MILGLLDEATTAGARLSRACKVVGLTTRTVQRWREQGGGDDLRRGPNKTPGNKLSAEENEVVLEILKSKEFVDQSPRQIVPHLADRDKYFASDPLRSLQGPHHLPRPLSCGKRAALARSSIPARITPTPSAISRAERS